MKKATARSTAGDANAEVAGAGAPEGPGEPGGSADGGEAQSGGAQRGDAQHASAERTSVRRGKRKKSWRQLLTIVVVAIIVMLLVKAFVVQVYRIPSQSMENTLLPGDRVLVNRVVYHLRGIDRGDIVVFSGQGSWGNTSGAPDPVPSGNPLVRLADDALAATGLYSTQTYYIKRVIGLPGDHVACCTDGKVTVNGVPLNEISYLYPGASPSLQQFSVIVPPGRLWVMGDNRADSADSRSHMVEGYPDQGTIPENEVAGRAFLVIWPPSQIRDLPIPATFQQAALHAGVPSAAAAILGAPLLARRVRRSRRGPRRRRCADGRHDS